MEVNKEDNPVSEPTETVQDIAETQTADPAPVGMSNIVFYPLALVGRIIADVLTWIPTKLPSSLSAQQHSVQNNCTLVVKSLRDLEALMNSNNMSEASALQDTIASDIKALEALAASITSSTDTKTLQAMVLEIYAVVSFYNLEQEFIEFYETVDPWWQTMFSATCASLVYYAKDTSRRTAHEFGEDSAIPDATLPTGDNALKAHSPRQLRLLSAIMLRSLSRDMIPSGTQTSAIDTLLSLLSHCIVTTPSEQDMRADPPEYAHYPPFDPSKPLDAEASPMNTLLHAFSQKMGQIKGQAAQETALIAETNQSLNSMFKPSKRSIAQA